MMERGLGPRHAETLGGNEHVQLRASAKKKLTRYLTVMSKFLTVVSKPELHHKINVGSLEFL